MSNSTDAPKERLPLEGLRVLELGHFISAAFATRQLALLGAEVWKLEPPTGDSARRAGPFVEDQFDPEASGLFLTLNVAKRGITLNHLHPDSREVIAGLLGHVDVVVENLGQSHLQTIGWGFEAMAAINGEIVVASITPYGLEGRKAGHEGTHLSIHHAGGEGFTLPGGTGWLLYGDREPIQSGANIAHYDTGIVASAAVLTSVVGRTLGNGSGAELLDISEQEAQIGVNRVEMSRWPNVGLLESRATRSLPAGDIFQCLDGYVQIEPMEWNMWRGVCVAMGKPELATDERFKDQASLFANGSLANQYMAEWAVSEKRETVYNTAQKNGCVAGVVRGPRDLLETEQLSEHGFFAAVEGADYVVPFGSHRFASGSSFETDQVVLQPAPKLGQDNFEVYEKALQWSATDLEWNEREGIV